MAPITTVIGRVTAADGGQLLPNARAYLYPVGSENSAAGSCTGADGRGGVPRNGSRSDHLAFADSTGVRATEWYGGSYTRAGATPITLSDGQQQLDADVVMDQTGAISGTVSNSDGPMADVCVYSDDNAGVYTGVGWCTDATGSTRSLDWRRVRTSWALSLW